MHTQLEEPAPVLVSGQSLLDMESKDKPPKTPTFNAEQSDPASSPESATPKQPIRLPLSTHSSHAPLDSTSQRSRPTTMCATGNQSVPGHAIPHIPESGSTESAHHSSMEEPVPIPANSTSEARPDISSETLPPPSASTGHKKKKKRKNNSNTRDLDESEPLPNEASIRGDGLDQWRARAINRRALLAKAKSDHSLLSADLSAALARVADAEHAEATVNKGLVTARSVIAQRDRAIADLTSAHQQLKGEHAKVVEDKKRAEKRLLILKTVSANLQDAREGRDNAERKLEDLGGVNRGLLKQIEALEEVKEGLEKKVEELRNQVDALNMLKQQLSRVELELEDLKHTKEELRVTAKKDSVRAAGIGAAGVFALSLTLRLLRGRKE